MGNLLKSRHVAAGIFLQLRDLQFNPPVLHEGCRFKAAHIALADNQISSSCPISRNSFLCKKVDGKKRRNKQASESFFHSTKFCCFENLKLSNHIYRYETLLNKEQNDDDLMTLEALRFTLGKLARDDDQGTAAGKINFCIPNISLLLRQSIEQ